MRRRLDHAKSLSRSTVRTCRARPRGRPTLVRGAGTSCPSFRRHQGLPQSAALTKKSGQRHDSTMRVSRWLSISAVGFVACSEADPSQVSTQSQTVAVMASHGNTATLAFAAEEFQSRLDDVQAGQKPKDFHWVMFTLSATQVEELSSPSGLSIDFLSSVGSRFEQVYLGPCNPALGQFQSCFLYEDVSSGASGVKGVASMRIDNDRFEGNYDVSIEGNTERFGQPVQWHRHGSIGTISAKLVEAAQ